MKKWYFISALAMMVILFFACQKEKSFEVGNNPSDGTLQSEATGDCLPKVVNGLYVAETPLVATTNTIAISVNVTQTGTYTITSDTVNGYFFLAKGQFVKLGTNAVTLRSSGTPFVSGINNFVLTYNNSSCDIAVTVLPKGSTPAVYTLESTTGNCSGAVVNGSYATGIDLNFTNTVSVSVNVTTIGTYSVTTTKNGMTFTGSGAFTTTGVQTIILNGTGIPTVGGDNIVPITAGTSTCNFTVKVGAPAVGTFGGAGGACTGTVVNGTYTVGTPLVGTTNTIDIPVTVTTPGVFSISTNIVGGISFSASGTFSTTGNVIVTLNGVGTPVAPSGTKTFTVTFGTSTCTFDVAFVGGPAGSAVFTPNCAGATVQGTYKAGTALTSANTITLPINVTTAGTYTISTTVTNGMIFTATGTLAAGPGTIILSGSGSTPTAAAAPSNIPMPGSPSCTVPVTVTAATGGGTAYVPDCSSAEINGLYEATTQLNVSNFVDIDVNVTTAGPYSFTIPAVNGITFTSSGTFAATGPATIRLLGSGTPTAGGSFTINVPGTTPCSFSLVVDAVPVVDWKFTVSNPTPSITYQGQTDDAELQVNAGTSVFIILGSNSDGTDDFQMGFSDLNAISAGDTYSSASTAAFSYAPVTATGSASTDPYQAGPTVPGTSMTFTVLTHNTTTKTITGTLSGTAKNTAGQTITITNGTFRGTYP